MRLHLRSGGAARGVRGSSRDARRDKPEGGRGEEPSVPEGYGGLQGKEVRPPGRAARVPSGTTADGVDGEVAGLWLGCVGVAAEAREGAALNRGGGIGAEQRGGGRGRFVRWTPRLCGAAFAARDRAAVLLPGSSTARPPTEHNYTSSAAC